MVIAARLPRLGEIGALRGLGILKGLGALALILGAILAAGPVRAQASPPPYDTTDDVRRLPIPPVDRSREPVIVLSGGTLIDGRGGRSIPNAVVVTQGDRIVAAGPAASTPVPANAARVIDTSGLYMMPGLIDLHIHFTQQRGQDMGLYADSPAAAAIRGVALAEQLIGAGITAARDVGTVDDVALRIKEAVDRRIIRGPRVFWSGRLIASRGGHGDEVTSTATGRQRAAGASGARRVAGGPWDWREAVREQVRALADWIKISAPATEEELRAAIEEAHSLGVPVAIDSFGSYTDAAIRAGVDTLEHPLDMSDESIALMRRHGTAFVPTIGAFHNLLTTGYPVAGITVGGFYHTHSRRFPIDQEAHLRRITQAHRAGVPIGVGTDIPFENEARYPDAYFQELDYLRQAGMSNADVLASATRVGAEIMRMGDKLGTIEPGKIADILITAADPLEDLRNLRQVRYVIADGEVVVERARP